MISYDEKLELLEIVVSVALVVLLAVAITFAAVLIGHLAVWAWAVT